MFHVLRLRLSFWSLAQGPGLPPFHPPLLLGRGSMTPSRTCSPKYHPQTLGKGAGLGLGCAHAPSWWLLHDGDPPPPQGCA